MKILQVAPYFPPYSGGQERFVYNLSKYLAKEGHEVTIMTSNFPKSDPISTVNGCLVKRYNIQLRVLRNPISFGGIINTLSDIKDYDVVHAHNEHALCTMMTAATKKFKKFPFAITSHGRLQFGIPSKDRIADFYDSKIGIKVFNSTDAIAVLSDFEKRYLDSLLLESKKIVSIPNAIDIDAFNQIKKGFDPDEYRENNFGEKYSKIVLFVGSISYRKGVPTFLEAIESIIGTYGKDILFLFVGRGDYESEAMRYTAEHNLQHNVAFLGNITDDELRKLYQIADLFVLPSFSEGMPTSILEAMYYGLPVITTNLPSIVDRFKNTAMFIKPGSSVELAEAVCDVLSDTRHWNQKISLGKELVKTQYNWQAVAREYSTLYADMVAEY